MTKAEFDEFAKSYTDLASKNTSFFGGDYGYFGRYRSNIVKRLSGAEPASILDFGCGIGLGVSALREVFPRAKIVGCDPSQESLAVARQREPECEFVEVGAIGQGRQFDIVTAISVFHHIVPAERADALRYCYERLKLGGRLFVFEHNPYNPVTRHLVAGCPFDRHAILLTRTEAVARLKSAGFDRIVAAY